MGITRYTSRRDSDLTLISDQSFVRLLVLGSGLQGSACAYDLLQDSDVESVALADVRVPDPAPFLAEYVGERLRYFQLDVTDRGATLAAMRDVNAVMSAAPYYFNADLAQLAVESGVHFCDLGGNTEIVTRQKELHNAAKSKRVSVIPDCGLAPGMVNILAQHGIDQLDSVDQVRIYVGGLRRIRSRRSIIRSCIRSKGCWTITRRRRGYCAMGDARRWMR